MAGVAYQVFSSSAMAWLGLYHLVSTMRNHLRAPRDYVAKPYHPLSLLSHRFFRYLQLYLLILTLFVASLHQALITSYSDPLLPADHRFTSLQSAAVLFLFLILSIFLLLSETTSLLPFPPDLFFGAASALFFLHCSVFYSPPSIQISSLEAKCDSVSARISAIAGVFCLVLAGNPRIFVADVGLGASFVLHGLWALQTGLSLYVDAFIPEGCHRMLDVISGVEGSTKCDLDESKLRAFSILDLAFVLHVSIVLIVVVVIYAAIAKTIGVRRLGSYEALPTDADHIQMKAISGNQA